MAYRIVRVLCFSSLLALAPLGWAETTTSTPTLETGYHQMYNLQFQDAHQTFREWQVTHPDDPLGPASDAAAFLFAEFDRLGVLQSELFVDDDKFKRSPKLAPDAAAKQKFENALARSQQIAARVLARSPQDGNALFAKVLSLGLRSDYVALIEKRYLASLSYMKSAGILADKLLAVDPSRYDAYLATGVENYMLGLNSAPVRWLLRIYGAPADKAEGIRKLRLTAEKGHYLQPFERRRLLLSVAAMRDQDRKVARELLAELAREYPNNGLYARELGRLQ